MNRAGGLWPATLAQSITALTSQQTATLPDFTEKAGNEEGRKWYKSDAQTHKHTNTQTTHSADLSYSI